jgi:hypothetical protein
LLAGGIVFFMQTPDGVVRIQIDDPDVKVSVEGEKAVITQKNAKPITITPGKRGLTIERDGFEFETTEFTLKRRQDTILTVQWLKGNEVVVRQDEREIHRSFAKAKTEVRPGSINSNAVRRNGRGAQACLHGLDLYLQRSPASWGSSNAASTHLDRGADLQALHAHRVALRLRQPAVGASIRGSVKQGLVRLKESCAR